MANDSFAFKQFTIKQDKCAMKVSTDAVLLGSWVIPNGSKTILDIGHFDLLLKQAYFEHFLKLNYF